MTTPLESVTISGTAQEGQPLTASVSPAGATASYQWMQSSTKSKADNYQPISGATSEAYTLTAAEVGKYVLCEAAGTEKYSGTKRSSPTEAVKAKPIAVTAVSISGTVQVGQTLTADLTPPEATATYKWQKADTSDGSYSDISGTTGKTYLLTEVENGKFIKVVVSGTGSYTGTVESAPTAAVSATGA